MADTFALLKEDGRFLFARQRGGRWQISESAMEGGPRGRNLTVFLPGQGVLGIKATLPARSDHEARRAAPFAVEDEIAEPVEDIHVALADQARGTEVGERRLNIVSKPRLQGWIDHLKEAGFPDATLLAAHSLLPDDNWIVSGPDLALASLAGRSFTLDADLAPEMLAGLMDRDAPPKVIGTEIANTLGLSAEGESPQDEAGLLIWLAQQVGNGATGINLRQAAFAPRRQVDLTGLRQWRFAGGLAAALGVCWVGYSLVDTMAMQTRTTELDRLTSEFVAAGWPEAGGDVQRALALSRAQGGEETTTFPSALIVTSLLYQGLADVPDSELRSLRYDGARGRLSVVVSFNDYGDVDALANVIEATGLSVTTGDSRQSGAKVVSDLILEAPR